MKRSWNGSLLRNWRDASRRPSPGDSRLRAFPAKRPMSGFDFSFQPTLSERRLRELADLSFVRTCPNLVVLGPPGTGKTHLSLALAGRALTEGYSVLFTPLADLGRTLESASHPSLVRQRLRRYISPSLLVIDEVGYTRLSQEQAHLFFELVAARYEHGSIILPSNTSFAGWGKLLGGDEVLATALLDRLLHHAEVISINGRSYRMKEREPLQMGEAASPEEAPRITGAQSTGARKVGAGIS